MEGYHSGVPITNLKEKQVFYVTDSPEECNVWQKQKHKRLANRRKGRNSAVKKDNSNTTSKDEIK